MKHAIVTGGSSGIGAAVAAELAARGYRLTIIGRSEDRLVVTANAIARGVHVDRSMIHTVAVDVRDRARVGVAIREAVAILGNCDVLVTSAGVALPGKFQELPSCELRRQMGINYHGSVNCIAEVYPAMVKSKKGRICLVASGASLIGIFGHTAYAPTKFAIRGFAEALRFEARLHNIKVSICYPPDTDTPLLQQNLSKRPLETSAIAGSAGVATAESVARQLVDGVESGRARILIGWQLKALAAFGPLLAPLLRTHFDRVTDRVGANAGSSAQSWNSISQRKDPPQ